MTTKVYILEAEVNKRISFYIPIYYLELR